MKLFIGFFPESIESLSQENSPSRSSALIISRSLGFFSLDSLIIVSLHVFILCAYLIIFSVFLKSYEEYDIIHLMQFVVANETNTTTEEESSIFDDLEVLD